MKEDTVNIKYSEPLLLHSGWDGKELQCMQQFHQRECVKCCDNSVPAAQDTMKVKKRMPKYRQLVTIVMHACVETTRVEH